MTKADEYRARVAGLYDELKYSRALVRFLESRRGTPSMFGYIQDEFAKQAEIMDRLMMLKEPEWHETA